MPLQEEDAIVDETTFQGEATPLALAVSTYPPAPLPPNPTPHQSSITSRSPDGARQGISGDRFTPASEAQSTTPRFTYCQKGKTRAVYSDDEDESGRRMGQDERSLTPRPQEPQQVSSAVL